MSPYATSEKGPRSYNPANMVPNPYGKNRMLSPAAISYRLHLGSELNGIKDLAGRRAYAIENHIRDTDRTSYMQVAGVFGDASPYPGAIVRRTHWKILETLAQPLVGDEKRRMVASLVFHWIDLFYKGRSSENSLYPGVQVIDAALLPENAETIRIMYGKYLAETGRPVLDALVLAMPTPPLVGIRNDKEALAAEAVAEEGQEEADEEALEEGVSPEAIVDTSPVAPPVALDKDIQDKIIAGVTAQFFERQHTAVRQELAERTDAWRQTAEETFTAIENGTRATIERVSTEVLNRKLAWFTDQLHAQFVGVAGRFIDTMRETYSDDMKSISDLERISAALQERLEAVLDENVRLQEKISRTEHKMRDIRESLGMTAELAKEEEA